MSKLVGFSIVAILLVAVISVFMFMNLSFENTKNAIEVKKKLNENLPAEEILDTEEVSKKAAFAIFTNGTFRIFTDSKYHNLSEDVYLEASNPNIIHVKKIGITYNDFFQTLPMNLTRDCLITGTGQTFCNGENGQLKFYLNGGERVDDLLEKEIKNGDRALISFGDEDDQITKDQLDILNSF